MMGQFYHEPPADATQNAGGGSNWPEFREKPTKIPPCAAKGEA